MATPELLGLLGIYVKSIQTDRNDKHNFKRSVTCNNLFFRFALDGTLQYGKQFRSLSVPV